MESVAGFRLFLLGVSAGLATLMISAYRRVSPRWLRWLLFGSGLLVVGRYLALAAQPPPHDGLGRIADAGSLIGLTLPGVFAMDQLLRHPAITPKTLLQWYGPFAAVATTSLFFGSRHLSSLLVVVFAVGVVGGGVFVIRTFPSPAVRPALLALMLGYGALGAGALGAGALLPLPHLPEMLTSLALWYAYDTAAEGGRGG